MSVPTPHSQRQTELLGSSASVTGGLGVDWFPRSGVSCKKERQSHKAARKLYSKANTEKEHPLKTRSGACPDEDTFDD